MVKLNRPVMLLIAIIFTFTCVQMVSAFDFYGYTKYTNATNMSYVNVSVEVMQFAEGSPPTAIAVFSNLSDAAGYFILAINSTYMNSSYSYKPVLIRYNGTAGTGNYATYIGASLPDFPYQDFSSLNRSAITFYLKGAVTVDLSAIGLEHASSNVTNIANYSFPTNYKTGLKIANITGYGDGQFWAYVNNTDCLVVLNPSRSVNMTFCNLNITNISDLTYTNMLGGARFYLANATQVEMCNFSSGSLDCLTNASLMDMPGGIENLSQVLGIDYVYPEGLFYISGTDAIGVHWMVMLNSTLSPNSSMNRPDSPYSAGKLEYYSGYIYTAANDSVKGMVIYRCSIGSYSICEDYSAFASGEDVKGVEFNPFDGKWYYSSTLNNSIMEMQNPFTNVFNFFYQVKDTTLGYPVKETFSEGGSGVTSARFYLPSDRGYSLMIYPNSGPGFPAKVDLSNLTDGNNISLGDRNATILSNPSYLSLLNANMSTEFVQLTGYARVNVSADVQNYTNFTVIAYLIEGGNMVFKGATLPRNMGQWHWPRIYDVFNTTTGFYNMTLPASVLGANLLLFASASSNESGNMVYYGGFKNITLYYGQTPSQKNITAYPLMGSAANLTLGFEGGSSTDTIPTALKRFTIQANGTAVSQAHVEIQVEYPAPQFNGSDISFSWMGDVGQTSNGNLDLPLLNYSIKKIKVFSSQYAPLQKPYTKAQLQGNPVYVNLSQFSPQSADGQAFNDIDMMMYIHKDDGSCSIPNPSASCSPISQGINGSDFNPFSMVIGGGKLDFEMKKTSNNITVRYIDVDLLASGPPDAMFDSSANSSSSESSVAEAWRFGSMGPEIYSYVLIGVPYNASAINESSDIKINITKFYGESFSGAAAWEQGINSTLQLTGTDYSAYNAGSYANYINGTGVLCNSSDDNLTSGICYKDTDENMLWFKIPHFSGINPSVTGAAFATITSAATAAATTGGGSSAGGATTAQAVSESTTFANIAANAEKTFSLGKAGDVGVNAIVFTTIGALENVKITVTKLLSKPISVISTPEGGVYSYIEVNAPKLEGNTKESKIQFEVTKKWLADNEYAAEGITLVRFADNKWNALTTSKLREDSSKVYYEAITQGFSYFAISATKPEGPTEEQLKQGFTTTLGMGEKVRFSVSGETHHVMLAGINPTSVIINVSSKMQQAILAAGQDKSFDVNDDNYYDINVKLNSIESGAKKVSLTVKSVHEQALALPEEITGKVQQEIGMPEEVSKLSINALWVAIGVLLVILIVWFGYRKWHAKARVAKKKKKLH